MTRRRLRPDELELWKQVTVKTERLDPRSAPAPSAEAAKPAGPLTKTKPVFEAVPRQPSAASATAIARDLAPSISEQFESAALNMDKKAFSHMKRGKLKPEGRIDLHGMTLDRAHTALTRFILSSQTSGRRLVLVITGKGKERDDGGPIPVRYGVLRHQVPQWLSLAPLSSAVLQVTPAHLRHGGSGAYYVYLRKRR